MPNSMHFRERLLATAYIGNDHRLTHLAYGYARTLAALADAAPHRPHLRLLTT